ncbi:MAG: response regulator, partial [Gammaproteobacteria bacterium]
MPRAKALPRAHSLMPRGSADVGERILLVDDDVDFAEATVEYLAMQGFDCMSVHTADAFLGSIRDFEPQVALIDQRLGKDSGMSLLETLAAEFPHVVPIMMTGYGNTDSAVQALRRSAYDFLRKPVDPEDLVAALERALERQRLIRRGRDAELALLASEEKFSKAFIANPAAMAIVSMRDRQVVEVNESFEAFAGYLRTEVIGKTLAALGLWTDAADGEHFVEALRVDGKVRGRAMRLTSRTLGVRECVVSAVVVTIGGQTCAILSIEDLTRERVATRALGESEQRFRSLYHKMPAILLTLDPSGTIKSANAFGADMLGYEAEALIGASFHEYLLPDS